MIPAKVTQSYKRFMNGSTGEFLPWFPPKWSPSSSQTEWFKKNKQYILAASVVVGIIVFCLCLGLSTTKKTPTGWWLFDHHCLTFTWCHPPPINNFNFRIYNCRWLQGILPQISRGFQPNHGPLLSSGRPSRDPHGCAHLQQYHLWWIWTARTRSILCHVWREVILHQIASLPGT